MLKAAPFFFIFLPFGIALVAWLFGQANIVGMLIGALLHAGALVLAILWYGQSSHDVATLLLVVMLMLMSFWTVPWFGTLFSLVIPTTGPAPARVAHEAYKELSPEDRELLKQVSKTVLRFGATVGASHLREKGHTTVADALSELSRK